MEIQDIKTLDDWKTAMGTGFRLTKDEKARGISREVALAERVKTFQQLGDDTPAKTKKTVEPKKSKAKASRSRKGDILIRIRPQADVDSDYFEHLTGKQVEVVMDEKFYSWVDTKLSIPYDGDERRLLRHVLNLGLCEVITSINFEPDLKDHEDIFGTD
jgi:hypothetical protein